MDDMEKSGWKPGIFDINKSQVTRILRPKEMHALIAAARVEDETKWKWLQSHGITTEDVRAWLYYYLYSGNRFNEAWLIHPEPDKYDGRGIVRMPYYKGKRMRTVKPRNIFLSFKGREYMAPFFEAAEMPGKDKEEMRQTSRAFTTILHKAGERIGLSEEKFVFPFDRVERDELGNIVTEKKTRTRVKLHEGVHTLITVEVEIPKTYEEMQEQVTNGCMVRSFRHSWESWLYWGIGDIGNTTLTQIILSQGHDEKTSLQYYLNFGFDRKDDLSDIQTEVRGFGEVG